MQQKSVDVIFWGYMFLWWYFCWWYKLYIEMVRRYLGKILVGALSRRMLLFFDLAFLSGLPVAHSFFWYFFVSVDLHFYTSRKGVLFGQAELVSMQTFWKNQEFSLQLELFVEKNPPSNGPTFLARLLGRVKLWAIQPKEKTVEGLQMESGF